MELLNALVILLFELLVVVLSEVLCKNDKTSSPKLPVQSYTSGSGNSSRDGRNLLHWIHSFINSETDPYLTKVNSACLDGDLAECFKAKALSNLDEYFGKESYTLNENVCIVRMPKEHVRRIYQEPFEFSEGARADEPEWEQFVKFVSRKVERFLKSAAFEVEFSNDVTENGRYSPRFIDEIATELEAIEDKKAGIPSKWHIGTFFIYQLTSAVCTLCIWYALWCISPPHRLVDRERYCSHFLLIFTSSY